MYWLEDYQNGIVPNFETAAWGLCYTGNWRS